MWQKSETRVVLPFAIARLLLKLTSGIVTCSTHFELGNTQALMEAPTGVKVNSTPYCFA
jgi:hypothetical protein